MESHELKKLRSEARSLSPRVFVGKEGVSESVIAETIKHLDKAPLIKIRFSGHKDQKRELADQLAQNTKSLLVQMIGNNAVLYKLR